MEIFQPNIEKRRAQIAVMARAIDSEVFDCDREMVVNAVIRGRVRYKANFRSVATVNAACAPETSFAIQSRRIDSDRLV
jgi:hypothetical protein